MRLIEFTQIQYNIPYQADSTLTIPETGDQWQTLNQTNKR